MAPLSRDVNKSVNLGGDIPGVEYFWSTTLKSDKKTFKFESEAEEEEDAKSTLFLRTAVLGADAVEDQSNVVHLESTDCNGKPVKGAIFHLKKGAGGALMCSLDLSLNLLQGATFTLEGDGPVYISGNYLQEMELPDELEDYMGDSSDEDDELDESKESEGKDEKEEEKDEEGEEKEGKGKSTAAKRKATSKAKGKGKKAKLEEKDDVEEDDEVEDEEMEDEEEEEKDAKKSKKTEKTAKNGKKSPKKDTKKSKK